MKKHDDETCTHSHSLGLPEIGYIIAIASVIFGVTAVLPEPFISKGQKGLWILTILALNWIGLLWYYYVFYFERISNKTAK